MRTIILPVVWIVNPVCFDDKEEHMLAAQIVYVKKSAGKKDENSFSVLQKLTVFILNHIVS